MLCNMVSLTEWKITWTRKNRKLEKVKDYRICSNVNNNKQVRKISYSETAGNAENEQEAEVNTIITIHAKCARTMQTGRQY